MFSLCFKVVLSFLFVVAVFTEEDSPSGQVDNGGNEGDINDENPAESANEEVVDGNAEANLSERQTRGIGAITRNGKIKIGVFKKIKCDGLIPHGYKVRRGTDYSKSLGFFKELRCKGLGNYFSHLLPQDCKDIKRRNRSSKSGVYMIYTGGTHMSVFCDMTTDGGGWTVIQRRRDATSFKKTWEQYKRGFGHLKGSFWLGNQEIFTLTNSRNYELRIDMRDRSGNYRFAKYRSFKISNEAGRYRLSIGSLYSHNGVYNSMAYHNGRFFSTMDRDYDSRGGSCSSISGYGGWWYGNCFHANLNGHFEPRASNSGTGIRWLKLSSRRYTNLQYCEMKIR